MLFILAVLATSYITAIDTMMIAELKAPSIPEYAKHLTGQALIDYVNDNQPFFRADIPTMSYKQFKSRLMDSKYLKEDKEAQMTKEIFFDEQIPESFDAREKWPDCESIKIIRDQANCGSCWAVSAASAMSDRVCIQTKGANQTLISDADILACCGMFCGYGCVFLH
ncbi:unnamed protein product [Strongylus vulgaris]|uniref:Peptidase C1A papain C-terminal domain-containing protein n=1 Tax=Strongylus vulgaris TaxID=40348 RepID=A0A3P7IM75_STRVU|nr:unnamed protein product [Strongylus vulgaris]